MPRSDDPIIQTFAILPETEWPKPSAVELAQIALELGTGPEASKEAVGLVWECALAQEKQVASVRGFQEQTAQYEVEVQANYGIKKGTIAEFDDICERVSIAMKRIKNPKHPSFNVVGRYILNRLDTALFRYIESTDYERTKVYQKSIMGMLGLPIKYMGPVLQILILLLLVMNGFLFYKVLS